LGAEKLNNSWGCVSITNEVSPSGRHKFNKKKECERHRTQCRIRKRKQQIRDLAAALKEDETLLAQLDEQIRTLKNTSTHTSINGSILFDVPELLYCRIGN